MTADRFAHVSVLLNHLSLPSRHGGVSKPPTQLNPAEITNLRMRICLCKMQDLVQSSEANKLFVCSEDKKRAGFRSVPVVRHETYHSDFKSAWLVNSRLVHASKLVAIACSSLLSHDRWMGLNPKVWHQVILM